MPRFLITAEVTIGCYTIIEADDEARAREIAEGLRDQVHVTPGGAPGAYDWEDGFFVVEADGTVGKIRVEELEED